MFHIEYNYLRPKKAQALKRWYEEPFPEKEELTVWYGEQATILPLRKLDSDTVQFGRGGVVDRDGSYVSLSSIPLRIDCGYAFSDAEYRDEKVVYCGYLIHHWGHFLIEAVTRLWYFLENDSTIDKYVFFLKENEAREITGNYREFLELLKVWDKIELISKPTTFREVLIPERSLVGRTYYSQKLLNIFDTIAENVVPDPSWETPEKIFYSRSLLSKGNPYDIGFAAIDNFFVKNGYRILYPERVPLGQMIHYIRNAKTVASISGTLPHNMLFAKNGQHLEIVERLAMNVDNQVDINRIRQLNAVHIDADIPVYPTDFSGPYLVGYTPEMERFAQDHGYQAPDAQYLTRKHYKKCFTLYMKAYKDLYNYRWFMQDWYGEFTDLLLEGFETGMTYFGDYLNRKRPFLFHHYFQFHYWKQAVKRILGRD